MLTDERHRIIRLELASRGQVVANDLAVRFGISEDTARRDLRELSRNGECRRVYGGAVATAPHLALSERVSLGRDKKSNLARLAVTLLKPNQTLFIDGGSTNIMIANAIPQDMPLTVITNALGVASSLAEHELIKLIVLGGNFDPKLGTCVGSEALRSISQLHADLLFLGSCGVDFVQGVTAFDSAEAEVKRAMVNNSSSIAIAVTNDKLATAAPFRVVRSDAIQHLIVEQTAPKDILSAFESTGAVVHMAQSL
jgi:DeoR/GlpR family transcriptional regulator of sugar metabolism